MKIVKLGLFTNKFEKQKLFYKNILELDLLNENNNQFSFFIGHTLLSFIKSENFTPYHFAINIPSNKIYDALAWAKERVNIQPFQGNEIFDIINWNAQSFYFYDVDRNIVEFISRKNLELNTETTFTKKSLISISEIGVPTLKVEELYTKINNEFGLEKYDCDNNVFCAIGNENGLFVLINHSKKKWLPNMDTAFSGTFEIVFENSAGKKFNKLFQKDEFLDIKH